MIDRSFEKLLLKSQLQPVEIEKQFQKKRHRNAKHLLKSVPTTLSELALPKVKK